MLYIGFLIIAIWVVSIIIALFLDWGSFFGRFAATLSAFVITGLAWPIYWDWLTKPKIELLLTDRSKSIVANWFEEPKRYEFTASVVINHPGGMLSRGITGNVINWHIWLPTECQGVTFKGVADVNSPLGSETLKDGETLIRGTMPGPLHPNTSKSFGEIKGYFTRKSTNPPIMEWAFNTEQGWFPSTIKRSNDGEMDFSTVGKIQIKFV